MSVVLQTGTLKETSDGLLDWSGLWEYVKEIKKTRCEFAFEV